MWDHGIKQNVESWEKAECGIMGESRMWEEMDSAIPFLVPPSVFLLTPFVGRPFSCEVKVLTRNPKASYSFSSQEVHLAP